MPKERLTAFSDGVIAILITIMVLELKVPHGARWSDLAGLTPVFLSYVLSFIYVAIYWNNHHHFLQALEEVNGAILWANMNLLFWLSLIPFTTGWMGENHFSPAPTALYGASLMMAGIAYFILQAVVIRHQGPDGLVKRAVGRDLKGKLSPLVYLAGVALSFVAPPAAIALYALVALAWLIPDRRIETAMKE